MTRLYIQKLQGVWDEQILASAKTDYHCKIKQTLFIQDLRPAFNVNISSEKLMLY